MALNIWKNKLSALFEHSSNLSKAEMPKGLEIFARKPSLAQVALQAVKFRSSTGSISQAIDSVLKYQTKDNYSSVKYENTYRLGPDQNQKFNPITIKDIVEEILNENLSHETYEPRKVRELIRSVSDDIKLKVKPLIYHRYKIVVSVTIAPNFGQSLVVASRPLWNHELDNCCTVQFQNKKICVVAMIFVVYYD
jgi:hypothetical protein